MSDREKVIKGLEYHLKELSVGKTCFECPYWSNNPCEIQLITDAIALLKEQEAVVRCKDCDNKECCGRAGDVVCGIDGTPHRQDWFCADGERN